MGMSAFEHRMFEKPYSNEDVIYHKVDVTGKYGSAGRGLNYDVIFDKKYKYNIKVQGYDFNSINYKSSLGFGSPKDIDDLNVGLVSTHINEIYYTVYVRTGNETLLASADGIDRINNIHSQQIKENALFSLIAFVFLSVFFRFLKKQHSFP
ncbi:hypothetical protein [Vibrio lentus]|nr:hypothetical protein [Vibrio lentus]MCC4784584.1 hypothetical protein [Vibrio lentus]MCC4856707.1 hypothetical protein [Vibrio lentus]